MILKAYKASHSCSWSSGRVVLVNVHLFLIYSMNFTMTYYNGPFSHLLVNWMLKIHGLAQMRRQYFHQWEPRLLPSFFLQWDQSLRNWTRVLIRSPESWAPFKKDISPPDPSPFVRAYVLCMLIIIQDIWSKGPCLHFLAVQDSSIGDIGTQWVIQWVSESVLHVL